MGLNQETIYEKPTLTPNPFDLLYCHSIFLETDIAPGERSGVVQTFSTDVHPGYKDIKRIRGGVQWYMIESRDFISIISFKAEKEKGNFVSFNGQSIAFTLSMKQV